MDLSKLLSGIGNAASGIGGVLGLGYSIFKDQHLTGAQREANAFTADQNQKSMDFSAAQAQKQMDFQREMSNTSWQRGVQDMQSAGLNPALAYGQGGASAMQGAAASGSAGSSVDPGRGTSLSEMLQLAQLSSQVDLTRAQAENVRSQTGLNEINTEYRGAELSMFRPLSEAQLANLNSDLQSKEVQRRLSEANISETQARTSLEINQAVLASIDVKHRDELQSLEARLRIANISAVHQNTAESRKRVEKLQADINEVYQRAILEAAQAHMFDSQAENLLIQNDILSYDREQKEFQVKHKKLTYWIGVASQALGAVGSIATGFGAAGLGAKAFGLVGAAGSAFARNYSSSAFDPLVKSQRYGIPY